VALYASSAAATRPAGSIVGDGCDILDSSNPEAGTCEHSDRGLCSRPRGPCLMPAWGSNPDVERGDPSILCDAGSRGGGLHRCIRRTLKTVGLDVLAPGAS